MEIFLVIESSGLIKIMLLSIVETFNQMNQRLILIHTLFGYQDWILPSNCFNANP
jgi:hypothetical protein